MKDVMIPIDQAGRIVLPKSLREELAIKPGDVFKVSTHGSAVTLTPSKESAGFLRRGKALVFSTGSGASLSVETVNEVMEESREEQGTRMATKGHSGKRKP